MAAIMARMEAEIMIGSVLTRFPGIRLAVPAEVTFSTSGSAPIATIREAAAEDVGFQVAGG